MTLRKFVFEKAILLIFISAVCAVIQYCIVSTDDLGDRIVLWNLPTQSTADGSGDVICVPRACGGASILLLFGSPIIGAVVSIIYDTIRREGIKAFAANNLRGRFNNSLVRLQFVIVITALVANAALGGTLLSGLMLKGNGFLSLISMQMSLLSIAFVSCTFATLGSFDKTLQSS